MIFVTVGNDYRPFDRLVRKMDEIAPSLVEETLIQRGSSTYLPRNASSFDFTTMDVASRYLKDARLVVSHSGIGTILLCREFGTPLLIVPRRRKFGEHLNDHQMEVARALEERGDRLIRVLYEVDRLEDAVHEHWSDREKGRPPESAGRSGLVRVLREFLQGISP